MKNLRSARCSPFVISKVLAALMRKLITARARKNKPTAHMFADAHKDHSIPLGREGRKLWWASRKISSLSTRHERKKK